jgi:hypothetical protein
MIPSAHPRRRHDQPPRRRRHGRARTSGSTCGHHQRPARLPAPGPQHQPAHHVELWCEAAGMAPMLAQMVRYRDVSVYSHRRVLSVTVTYEVAQRVIAGATSRPTSCTSATTTRRASRSSRRCPGHRRVRRGEIGGRFYPTRAPRTRTRRVPFFIPQRVALTEDQVAEFDLPTAPPKLSATRARQVDRRDHAGRGDAADLLERSCKEALDELTDDDALDELKEREASRQGAPARRRRGPERRRRHRDRGLSDPSLLELRRGAEEQ